MTLKQVVNDPQGLVVTEGLHALGYSEVATSRVGKFIRLELGASGPEEARTQVDEMCRRLLCNGVIEEYRFQVSPGAPEP
ncbi:MAG: phosphoribosylformylglycinamidine synthase subunit PurS [Candidatus Dormibacteria bacterium]